MGRPSRLSSGRLQTLLERAPEAAVSRQQPRERSHEEIPQELLSSRTLTSEPGVGVQKGPPLWTSVDLGQPAQMHQGAEPPEGVRTLSPPWSEGVPPCQGMNVHVRGGSGQRILPAPRAGLWSHARHSRPEATQAGRSRPRPARSSPSSPGKLLGTGPAPTSCRAAPRTPMLCRHLSLS